MVGFPMHYLVFCPDEKIPPAFRDPDSTLKVHKKYPFVNFTIGKLCFKKLQVQQGQLQETYSNCPSCDSYQLQTFLNSQSAKPLYHYKGRLNFQGLHITGVRGDLSEQEFSPFDVPQSLRTILKVQQTLFYSAHTHR